MKRSLEVGGRSAARAATVASLAAWTLLAPRLADAAPRIFLEDLRGRLGGVAAHLVAADLDGDGRADLAAAIGAKGVVEVLRGLQPAASAPALFEAAESLPVGLSPIHICAADLDGDGRLDLLCANSGSASVSTLRNRGDGTFEEPRSFGVDSGPRFAEAARLDADGFLDVVTVNFVAESRGTLSVLLGDGTGGLRPERRRDVGDNPHALALGDFDGDGNVDAVVGHTDAVSFFPGLGTGELADAVVSKIVGVPAALVHFDADGDGVSDLFLLLSRGGDNDADLVRLRHGGAAKLEPETIAQGVGRGSHAAGAGPFGYLRAEDFDGDGRLDLITEADVGGGSALRVFQGLEGGDFAPWTGGEVLLWEPFSDVLLADLDGDGAQDLFAAWGSSEYTVFPGSGGGAFPVDRPSVGLTAQPEEVLVGAFAGDPALDILVRTSAGIDLVAGAGARSFARPEPILEAESAEGIAVGDLDGDGDRDLALADLSQGAISLALLDASGRKERGLKIRWESVAAGIAAADLDGDGAAELLVPDLVAPRLQIITHAADAASRSITEVALPSPPALVLVASLDGDEGPDVLVATRATLELLEADGAGGLVLQRSLPGLGRLRDLSVLDFDGDGASDILAVQSPGDVVGLIAPALSGAWRPLVQGDFELRAARAADLDGDGRMDLAATFVSPTEGLAYFHADAAGGFEEPDIYRTGLEPRGLAIADLDGDGRLDAVVAGSRSSLLTLHWGVAPEAATFLRGDADGSGALSLTDAVFLLDRLFKGGPRPPCLEATDTNDDGQSNLSDAIYGLAHLFLGGPAPPPPYPDPGLDPTPDGLGC